MHYTYNFPHNHRITVRMVKSRCRRQILPLKLPATELFVAFRRLVNRSISNSNRGSNSRSCVFCITLQWFFMPCYTPLIRHLEFTILLIFTTISNNYISTFIIQSHNRTLLDDPSLFKLTRHNSLF